MLVGFFAYFDSRNRKTVERLKMIDLYVEKKIFTNDKGQNIEYVSSIYTFVQGIRVDLQTKDVTAKRLLILVATDVAERS